MINPTDPSILNAPIPSLARVLRTYTWTYTDCEGNSHPWSFAYTIERNDFTVPANGGQQSLAQHWPPSLCRQWC
ncbi:MAG: hypothetical protein IPM82_29700 [Saprospiraceae bacterium]|nr:hypothetical protein [Saprospiraceae bacterium]